MSTPQDQMTPPDQIYKKYRPKFYTAETDIGQNEGDTGTASFTVTSVPFKTLCLKHQIVRLLGESADKPEQDGLYRINWSISEQRRYFSGPPPMADFFGSVRHGRWRKFEPPLDLSVQWNISVQITNAVQRERDFRVQVAFEGYERNLRGDEI